MKTGENVLYHLPPSILTLKDRVGGRGVSHKCWVSIFEDFFIFVKNFDFIQILTRFICPANHMNNSALNILSLREVHQTYLPHEYEL